MKPRHFIACFLCAVFIVYPLSIGPAAMLVSRFNNGSVPQWTNVFYTPLILVCEEYRPLTIALGWYVEKCYALGARSD